MSGRWRAMLRHVTGRSGLGGSAWPPTAATDRNHGHGGDGPPLGATAAAIHRRLRLRHGVQPVLTSADR